MIMAEMTQKEMITYSLGNLKCKLNDNGNNLAVTFLTPAQKPRLSLIGQLIYDNFIK